MNGFDAGKFIDDEVADVLDIYEGVAELAWEAMLEMARDGKLRHLLDDAECWLVKVELERRLKNWRPRR